MGGARLGFERRATGNERDGRREEKRVGRHFWLEDCVSVHVAYLLVAMKHLKTFKNARKRSKTVKNAQNVRKRSKTSENVRKRSKRLKRPKRPKTSDEVQVRDTRRQFFAGVRGAGAPRPPL